MYRYVGMFRHVKEKKGKNMNNKYKKIIDRIRRKLTKKKMNETTEGMTKRRHKQKKKVKLII